MAAGKQRQLNYELLRIVAMLMIVCLHYLSKGGLLGNPARTDMTATGYTVWLVEAFCLVAVNVYVLLSGYFGVDASPGDAVKRPFRIWRQVFFYSVALGTAAFAAGAQEFNIYRFFSYCFPIVTEHYWFATSYIILCLFMPFLNAGFAYLDRKGIRALIFGLLVIFSISKTVIPMQLPWDKYGYDGFWFVVLYLTGAYLRRYGIRMIGNRGRALLLYLGSVAVIFASFFLIRILYLRTGKLEDLINYGYTYNFLFCYSGAIGLFLAFARAGNRQDKAGSVPERFRKPVELFSGSSFGVYLIHEHGNIRDKWPEWFHCGEQINRSVGALLLHMVCTVLTVYMVCTLIELIRRKLSEAIFRR